MCQFYSAFASGADITDYFNYGFTEETWRLYCDKQRKMKTEVGNLNKIAVSLQVTQQTWYSSCVIISRPINQTLVEYLLCAAAYLLTIYHIIIMHVHVYYDVITKHATVIIIQICKIVVQFFCILCELRLMVVVCSLHNI